MMSLTKRLIYLNHFFFNPPIFISELETSINYKTIISIVEVSKTIQLHVTIQQIQ